MATTSPLPESSVSESVRKSRWSEPFGEMTDESIAEVLRTDLFSRICKDEASAREELFKSFGTSVSIYGILKNDTRIHSYEKGEIVVRKGDYGNSAYFLIDGEWACILSPDLSPDVLGQPRAGRRVPEQRWRRAVVFPLEASNSAVIAFPHPVLLCDEPRSQLCRCAATIPGCLGNNRGMSTRTYR